MRIFLGFCRKFVRSSANYCSNLSQLIHSPVFKGLGIQRGNSQPVFVVPGFLVGDISTFVMRLWLTRIGYRVYASDLSSCRGCPYLIALYLEKKLLEIYTITGQPVIMIGYSLGGIMVRFLASKHRDKVRHTITISSPSPDTEIDPFLRFLFRKFNPQCIYACDCELIRESKIVLPISETLIYSRDDETVSLRNHNSHSGEIQTKKYYEVSGRHGGLVVSPEVYKIIADSLNNLSRYC